MGKKLTILVIVALIATGTYFYFFEDSSINPKNSDNDEEDITREDARDIAEEAILISYQYVRFEGHNLDLKESGRGRDGRYIFNFQFDVDTEHLPERVTGFSAVVDVYDQDEHNISMTEITE